MKAAQHQTSDDKSVSPVANHGGGRFNPHCVVERTIVPDVQELDSVFLLFQGGRVMCHG